MALTAIALLIAVLLIVGIWELNVWDTRSRAGLSVRERQESDRYVAAELAKIRMAEAESRRSLAGAAGHTGQNSTLAGFHVVSFVGYMLKHAAELHQRFITPSRAHQFPIF